MTDTGDIAWVPNPKQSVLPAVVAVSNKRRVVHGKGSVVQAENVQRRRSELLLPKLADVIKSVPPGWQH